MQTIRFRHAWLSDRFADHVSIDIASDGTIAAVRIEADDAGAERIDGIAIPGMVNVHSHAFQRGMAGLTEYTTGDHDSFWTWRRLMYHFLRHLTPDDCYVLARQLYVEMLLAGYTAVGEFHYLHNDPAGAPYAARGAMAESLIAAAQDTGIRMAMLPALYQRGGFDRPLEDGQKRFALSEDAWIELTSDLHQRHADKPRMHFGWALHSLRAVDMAAAMSAIAAAERALPGLPRHMHIAEQQKEVDDCRAAHGRHPVAWAMEELAIDRRWCLIHATHMDSFEREQLAKCGAVAGLCPSTEANLGDGVFPSESYLRAGGRFAIGSDSHIGLDPWAELRLIEYAQRLSQQRRVVLVREGESCGQTLCASAWTGGNQALGLPSAILEPGALADLIVLDANHPNLAGLPPKRWLDSLVFNDIGSPVRDIMVGGIWAVRNGVHALAEVSRREFAATVRRILESA